jgi:hypothetical protein
LTVTLQLGKRADDRKGPRPSEFGPRAEIAAIDPKAHRVQVTVGTDTGPHRIEPTTTAKFGAAPDSLYLRLHPPAGTVKKQRFRDVVRAKFEEKAAIAIVVGAAALVAAVAAIILIALGVRDQDPTSTAPTFWEPPALSDAEWAAAMPARCEPTSALGGLANRCNLVNTAGNPLPGRSLIPCFVSGPTRYICARDPWQDDGITAVSTGTTGATSSDNAGGSVVVPKDVELKPEAAWGIELADGRRCVLDFESGGGRFRCAANGKVIGAGATTSLGGAAVPKDGPWTIQVRISNGSSKQEKIAKAWGVFVSDP